MTLLVLFFGGQRDAVCAALRELTRSRQIRNIRVVTKAQEKLLTDEPFDGRLDDALESFAEGEVSSVRVHGVGSKTFIGSVFRPHFAGEVLKDWSGYVEGVEEEIQPSAFDELRCIEGLNYMGLSIEESPDFDVPHVTKETFPWSDWRLVAGAVRGEDAQWSIRRNPGVISAT